MILQPCCAGYFESRLRMQIERAHATIVSKAEDRSRIRGYVRRGQSRTEHDVGGVAICAPSDGHAFLLKGSLLTPPFNDSSLSQGLSVTQKLLGFFLTQRPD